MSIGSIPQRGLNALTTLGVGRMSAASNLPQRVTYPSFTLTAYTKAAKRRAKLSRLRGALAEWLRSGLQSRLHRFDSGRRLSESPAQEGFSAAWVAIEGEACPECVPAKPVEPVPLILETGAPATLGRVYESRHSKTHNPSVRRSQVRVLPGPLREAKCHSHSGRIAT
jgi:hypothetical protein